MNKITKYWLEHSDYDFETAKAMLKAKRYLYVAFMCHQAIEKLLKSIITNVTKVTPPRSHDLTKLSIIAQIEDDLSKNQIDFLAELTPFCIITRYAGYKKKLSQLTNVKLAKSILKRTEEFIKWLKKKAI